MQDQRVAALEDQMAKTLLQCEQEKEKILNALKTERALRRQAEADISVLTRGPSPAEEVQHQPSLQTPSAQQQCVIKQIVELALDNTALKKQIGDKELRWNEEKEKIVKALKAERATRRSAEASLKKRIGENALREEAEKKIILEALREERAMRKEERAANNVINKKLEDENQKLKQSVMAKEAAIEFTKSQWRSQMCQADKASDARWKSFIEINAALKNTLNTVVQELSDLITETTSEKAVLEAKLKNTESEVVQGEAEYRIKLAAMEEKMTAQLAAKTTSVKVLEAKLKNTESKVVQGEAEYMIKLAAMEEEMTARTRCLAKRDDNMEQTIGHLKQQHIELQASNIELRVINRDLEALAQRTDKEKAKLRKDAEKAAKEAAERVRKEEKENKKKAEELLKTQKKESEAKLARDAKEQKRQEKERKLREKRGEA